MMRLPTRQNLVRYSRDRGVLLRSSLVLVAVATALAFLASLIAPAEHSRLHERAVSGFAPEGKSALISLIRFGLPLEAGSRAGNCARLLDEGEQNPFAPAIEAALAKEPDELIEIWWRGLQEGNATEAIARLESADAELRHRNEFLADLKYRSSDAGGALRHYLAEAERFEAASYARRSALFLARLGEDKTLVRELLDDASVRRAFAPSDLFSYQAYAGDYVGLARSVLLSEARSFGTIYLIPALFTAAIWFFILLAFREHPARHVARALVAFALGVVSAVLTLYLVVLQQERGGPEFHPDDSALAQFVFFLSGVALREESLKLLCFFPLALALRRRGSPVEALVLAGMVGLGFAFQENLLYFEAGSGTFTAWLRLLTANALHFSLTGVAGWYLWKMLRRSMRGWEEFLLAFLAVVFAHALYNALLAMPALSAYAPLSPIWIAVIAYQYFDPLRQHMETAGQHQRLSPLGIFILGSVILTCTIFVGSAMVEPFRFALGAFVSSVAAMIPLAFAFIGRFRDL